MTAEHTRWCPECGAAFAREVVACPRCRAILLDEPPVAGGEGPVVVHRVPDAAAGALLCGVLEHHGIRAVLRSTTLPGYGTVPRPESIEARTIIADYLADLARGGAVRDEDVEGEAPP
jgi:hypothetical protein